MLTRALARVKRRAQKAAQDAKRFAARGDRVDT
jgi:hypothetical protein